MLLVNRMLVCGLCGLMWAGLSVANAAPGQMGDGGAGAGQKQEAKDKPGPKGGKPAKQAVTMEQVPDAVRQAIKKQAGDSEIAKLEKETKEGKTSYKAEWLVKEMKQELKLAEDGGVTETKQQISPEALPAAVAEAARKTIPDLKGAECKKVTKAADGSSEERYEIKADVEGAKKHLVISTDGQVEVKGPGGPKGPKGPKGPQDGPPAGPQ